MAVGLAFAPSGVTVGEAPPPPPPPGPDDVAALQGWYAASDVAGADGSSVSSVTDLSGLGNTLTQGTGAAQPTLQTAELNGENVFRFDGGDYLNTATYGAALAVPNTYFIVGKATPDVGTNQAFIDGILHPNRNMFRYSTTASYSLYAGDGVVGGGVAPDASWHIMVPIFNGASSRIYIDGGSGGSGMAPGSNSLGGLRVGSNAGLDEGVVGDIAEVVVYNALVSDSDINIVGNYLADKYALTWVDI